MSSIKRRIKNQKKMANVSDKKNHASLLPTLLHDFRQRQMVDPDARIALIEPVPVLPVTQQPTIITTAKNIRVDFEVSTIFQNEVDMLNEFNKKFTGKMLWMRRELTRLNAYGENHLNFIENDPQAILDTIKSNGIAMTVESLPFFEIPVTLVEYAGRSEIKFAIHFKIHLYKIERT